MHPRDCLFSCQESWVARMITPTPKAHTGVLVAVDDTLEPSETAASAGATLPEPPTVMTPATITSVADVLTKAGAHSDSTAASETDEQAIVRLAALSQMEYDRVRKAEAKALGGVQVTTLDHLVKAARDVAAPVDLLPFQDWEPYPEPVD